MDFFMSGEIDGRYDSFQKETFLIINNLENKLKLYLKDKDYGIEVNKLNVITLIIKFDEEMEKEGWFKERILFKRKNRDSDIRLRVDYDKFVKGNEDTKKLLLIDNIVKSIRALSKKAKNDFNAKKLEEDVLNLFNVTVNDLEML